MRTISLPKKHAVTLIFLLDEEVTPQLFARKVALACSNGALRPGEAVMVKDTKIAYVIGEKEPFASWLFERTSGGPLVRVAQKPTKTAKPTKKRRRV